MKNVLLSTPLRYKFWDKINGKWIDIFAVRFQSNGLVIALESLDGEMYGLHQIEMVRCVDLLDIKEKFIFNGDIVRRKKKRGFEMKIVKWESKPFSNAGWNIGPKMDSTFHTNWEIIGNIFENHDLIEKYFSGEKVSFKKENE